MINNKCKNCGSEIVYCMINDLILVKCSNINCKFNSFPSGVTNPSEAINIASRLKRVNPFCTECGREAELMKFVDNVWPDGIVNSYLCPKCHDSLIPFSR
jgi:hypothetical protein